ncbi:mycothiol synthase [Streptomonospora wellingtoniae]|uniref:Mycothiol acetyltransferase n=1 Tax=Streptomonospora wellingtoniae TaxID=3075544 RepID=A0ABU2KZG0_9ACTN|nr:mycothiol synthase [Streptomonospora sp. DSM 45055]MDT0304468.1 mycothiol synthase [Streptomonospora sp. DSM 45055]
MTHVRTTESLSPDEAAAVVALAEAAGAHDGVAPLSEQTLLRVRRGAPAGAARFHLAAEAPSTADPAAGGGPAGGLAGFAFAARTDGEPDSAELVVAPQARRRGNGAALLRSLADDAPRDGLRVWAHGRTEGAVALARTAGWTQVRGLLKMRKRMRSDERGPAEAQPRGGAALHEPVLPDAVGRQVVVRTFRPGDDEQAWLKANAAAFADHPEQGGMTLADLREREEEDWFDPAGFFVAEDTATGAMAGFHWTKVHADGAGLADEAVGEVYAVGVDPAWQRTGLGRALTLVGLRHLHERGLPWVLLYVDEENRAAVRLYESLGFSVWDADVMYAAQ